MPRPLTGHALAYNKNQNSVYVFGGSSDTDWAAAASPNLFNAIYEYKADLGVWSELAPSCANEFTCPPPSAGSVLIYNDFLNELSVVGGKKGRPGSELEQWYFSLNDNQWHVKQNTANADSPVCGGPRQDMMCTQDDRTWWMPTGELKCDATSQLSCNAANAQSDWFGFYFSFTKLNRFVINRSYAYMASNGGLQIATLAVDYLPVFAGWAPTDGAANDIIFDKNDDQYVYVADSSGINVFDIDFTLWPDLEKKVDVGEPVRGLAQHGTNLFAITAHSLKVFDISDPPRPRLISTLIIIDPELIDIDTDGSFAYVSGQTGLQIIDVRNVSAMQTLQYIPMHKVITHLRVENNVLYTVNEINETIAYKTTSPSRPLLLGGHTVSSWTKGIIVQGSRESQLNGNWMNLRKLK